jgi:conjugal transfer/type IV secretion protein DotA/TraY
MKSRSLLLVALTALCMAASMVAIGDDSAGIPAATQQQITELNGLDYSQDFGQKVINWIAHGSDNPTFGDKSLLSVVSLTLNAIALAMMAWLAVLGGATYIAQTANKGVPGGQVISSFWAPIRISTATILLIPLGSGFSTLQYGVITVAEKGNAHGSYLMGVGLDYLYDFGAYRSPGIPDGRAVVFALIESEVCRQYINSYTNKETITPIFTDGRQGNRLVAKVAYKFNEAPTWSWANDPRNDYCGAVAFSIEHAKYVDKEESKTSMLFDDKTAANGAPPIIAAGQAKILEATRAKVIPIAAKILSDENALRNLQTQGQSQQSKYEQAVASLNGQIKGAASDVQAAIVFFNSESQKLIASAVNTVNDEKNFINDSAGPSGWREQTKAMGWPALGTIFWQININQSAINKLANSFDATTTKPTVDSDFAEDKRFLEVASRVNGLKKHFATVDKTKTVATNQTAFQPESIPSLSAIGDAGAEGDGWVDAAKSALYEFFSGGVKAAMFKGSSDDLIINMQYFGSALSTMAEIAWWSKTITINVVRAAAETVDDTAKDAGNSFIGLLAKPFTSGVQVGSKTVSFALQDISGMLNYLILAMVVAGFTLGVVLPTIPLSMWLMGVVSWMLFFIECLLVSPMWMAAHGTADKDGWGGEHTRQGYMLMIGLYLNPILRVAGFFAIFLAMRPLGWMVSWFFDYVQGVVVSGFVMLFIFMGSVIISAIFAYTLLVRVFALPSELFERGLRWINGGQEVTGDSASEKEARHNIAAFGGKSESAASMKKTLPGTPQPTDVPGTQSPTKA